MLNKKNRLHIDAIIDRLGRLRFLNRGIIFTVDLFFALISTVLSYLYVSTLMGRWMVVDSLLMLIISSAAISSLLFFATRLYKVIIRHSTLKELPKIFYILLVKEALLAFIIFHFDIVSSKLIPFYVIIDLLITAFLMIGFRAFIVNIYYSIIANYGSGRENVFVYSTLEHSPEIAELINKDNSHSMYVKGFLTTNKQKNGISIYGIKVYWLDGNQKHLARLFSENGVRKVVFTCAGHFNRERDGLVEFCIKHNIQMFLVGDLQDIGTSGDLRRTIKPIQIEDLLGRDEISIEIEKIASLLHDKVVMVTGAAGSIGREIVIQLACFGVNKIVCVDNAETPLHELQLEIERRFPAVKARYCLGDVRSESRMKYIFNGHKPNIVFHAAAYKHVPMMEANPCEAIKVNIWGTLNIARIATENGVEKMVMVSTDKAVNPTNVMGASKRLAELCVQLYNGKGGVKFITTRFGNVLGSNGSVIPLFKEQIAAGGPITVTHPDVIRYFMTIPEACRLVLQACTMGQGGEIFVFDMGQQVKIVDLARRMIALSGLVPDEDIEIKFTGLRPGEKLYEELLSDAELTDVTSHDKIRVSKTMIELPEDFEAQIEKLLSASEGIEVENCMIMMKQLVPEFISANSIFEKYDKLS